MRGKSKWFIRRIRVCACALLISAIVTGIAAPFTTYAADAGYRTVRTSGGDKNVTYIEIALDDTYTVNALTARDSFGKSSATLEEFIGAIDDRGADTIVFPVNFFIPYDGSNDIVGAVVSQGRVINSDPQPWLDFGVGFSEDNEMSFFKGRISGGAIYGAAWNEPKLEDIVTAFNVYPHLIADGKKTDLQPTAGMSASWMDTRSMRAFMGQRADGTLVVGNVSSTRIGELQEIAAQFDLATATNIDGGASTALWRNGTFIARPGRQLASVAYITNNKAGADTPEPPPAGKPIDTADEWARDAVTSAISKGFVPADLQDNYKNTITRAEFCRLAVGWVEYALSKDIDDILTEKGLSRRHDAFSDTQDPDILAAYALGIISGAVAPTDRSPGVFDPDGKFNRQQAATLIMNACRAIGVDVSNPPPSDFVDLYDADIWARSGIDFVRAHGIMGGTNATTPTFSPMSAYDRQQSIMTFNNIKF